MLYFNYIFCNYKEFKEFFGSKERRNKLKLSYMMWKAPSVMENYRGEISIKYNHNMVHNVSLGRAVARIKRELPRLGVDFSKSAMMADIVFKTFCDDYQTLQIGPYKLGLSDEKYLLDARKGVCQDKGCENSIRYINKESGKIFCMKIGKFLRHFANPDVPESLRNWVIQELSDAWVAERIAESDYTIRVDSDFEEIYSSRHMRGNFNSCMTNKDHHTYYENCVDARAASLWDGEEMIARCVIFDKVFDNEGNVYRLAERQYASNQNHKYMLCLINRLIAQGAIDGYKRVGASFSDKTDFILNDGTSLNCELYIKCTIGEGDVISYQDSFSYYDDSDGVAYNCCNRRYHTYDLATTDAYIHGLNGGAYDEYNDEYVDEVVPCFIWRHGHYTTMDVDIDYAERNFYAIGDDYYDDVQEVHIWNRAFGYYYEDNERLDNLDEYYEIDGEYYDEVQTVYVWDAYNEEYDEEERPLDELEGFYEVDGEYYDVVRNNTDGYYVRMDDEVYNIPIMEYSKLGQRFMLYYTDEITEDMVLIDDVYYHREELCLYYDNAVA